MKTSSAAMAILSLSVVLSAPAMAAIPVVDIGAIQQLFQQVRAWQQQLRDMQLQLGQLQQTRAALTGARGMDRLLRMSPMDRNYLPPDWPSVDAASMGAPGANASLGRQIQSRVTWNAVLSPAEVGRFAPPLQALLVRERREIATAQTLGATAYAHSSAQFATLSTLIDQLGATPDAKTIADLQGRIAAEQTMLENDALKLSSLTQAIGASREARELARREAVVANHGQFSARFQPTPPAP
jgi:type IV secretion system protein VirB5